MRARTPSSSRRRRMPEIRVIAPGRTYRVDCDATHSPMFHQVEGLWIGEDVSFADLKACTPTSCARSSRPTRWRCASARASFPSPSRRAEIDMLFDSGPLKGRWLEISGSGQVHPNVVRNIGLDPERYIGFAFGIGPRAPDRCCATASTTCGLFFDGDLSFLAQFE